MKNHTENPFDLFEPPAGHRERFMRKLEQRLPERTPWHWRLEWVAAAVLIIGGFLFLQDGRWDKITGKAWPGIQQKQEKLTSYVMEQFTDWDNFETPEAREIMLETRKQILLLDEEFKKLEKEFQRTGNRFVLEAMIDNVNRKKQLLETMQKKLMQVEKLKRHEKQSHSS